MGARAMWREAWCGKSWVEFVCDGKRGVGGDGLCLCVGVVSTRGSMVYCRRWDECGRTSDVERGMVWEEVVWGWVGGGRSSHLAYGLRGSSSCCHPT